MKKNEINLREILNKYQENCERISQIADTCEAEKRERNESETAEFEALSRENQLLQMRMQAAAAARLAANPDTTGDANRIIRENMQNGRQTKITLVRDLMMVDDVTTGGLVPVQIQDIITPLAEGLILDKVGLPLPTGLSGDYVWPVYEAVEATIAGEGVALSDTKIPMSKLTAAPQRVGIAIPVTRQSIMASDNVVETIVKSSIPLALARLLNKIMFSTTKVAGATTLAGPFTGIATAKVKSLSAEPTFKEYNAMKAELLATGIDGEHMCWVMTKSQKAIAEATPKDAGSGVMVCEGDRIAGLPVFTTGFIGEGNVGLGDWRYQPMGLFGDMSFIIDPYSQARKDSVDFVLNANYGTVTLRKEAFALAKVETE